MPTTLFRARVDTRRKNHAAKILKRYGLDLGEAVNVFLAKIEEVDGLPFDLRPGTLTYAEKEYGISPEDMVGIADNLSVEAKQVIASGEFVTLESLENAPHRPVKKRSKHA